jgi:2-hydroxy-3-keto-5-methylthiopentenyl-1-phosphate phosphatase
VTINSSGSVYGHDKSRAILPYRELPNPPTLFFFGDGVSGMGAATSSFEMERLRVTDTDISAAKHADILFVKQKDDGENDLATYCTRLGIRHILFTDFSKALPVVQSVVKGVKSVDEVLSIGKA